MTKQQELTDKIATAIEECVKFKKITFSDGNRNYNCGNVSQETRVRLQSYDKFITDTAERSKLNPKVLFRLLGSN